MNVVTIDILYWTRNDRYILDRIRVQINISGIKYFKRKLLQIIPFILLLFLLTSISIDRLILFKQWFQTNPSYPFSETRKLKSN